MKIKWKLVAIGVATGVVVATIVSGGVYLVSAHAGPGGAAPSAAAPTSGVAAAPTPIPRTPMDDFILEIDSHTEMTWTEKRSGKLTLGWAICADMSNKSRETMITEFARPPKPWTREWSVIVIDSATRHLCPHKSWGTDPVLTWPSAPANVVPDSGAPHFAIYGDGLYQVTAQAGADSDTRVAPGRYRTDGPSALSGVGCYWRKLDPDTRETVLGQSNYTHGSDQVTLNEGDWFETSGCSSWGIVR